MAAPVALDRNRAIVSRAVGLQRARSYACLRKSNGGAARLDLELNLIHQAGHEGQATPVLSAHRAVQHRHHEGAAVANREGQALGVGDDAQLDLTVLIGGAVANRVRHRLVDGEHELKARVGVESELRRRIGDVLAGCALLRALSRQLQLTFGPPGTILAGCLQVNQPGKTPRLPPRGSCAG